MMFFSSEVNSSLSLSLIGETLFMCIIVVLTCTSPIIIHFPYIQ